MKCGSRIVGGATAILLALVAGQLMAQSAKGKQDKKLGNKAGADVAARLFDNLDKNKNGKLEKEEAPERMKGNFALLDADGDGSISRDEYQRAFARLGQFAGKGKGLGKGGRPEVEAEAMLSIFDKNNDGTLKQDELPEAMRPAFAFLDGDRNGSLDKKELTRAIERRQQQGGRPALARSPRQMFNDQDRDADGRVTRAEAKDELASQFDKLDSNKDGKLDVQEVEANLKLPAMDKASGRDKADRKKLEKSKSAK